MGAAFYIVLDNKDPGFDTFVNGKFLSIDNARLERAARLLGLRLLGEYVSANPEEALAELQDLGGDPDGVELPAEQWFDCDEGLAWVSRVAEYVKAHPNEMKNADGVLSDLDEYRRVFEQAKAIGARWHLGVDY